MYIIDNLLKKERGVVGGKWKKNLDFWKSSILEEAYWPTNAPCPISGMEEEKFSLKKLLDRDDNTQKIIQELGTSKLLLN